MERLESDVTLGAPGADLAPEPERESEPVEIEADSALSSSSSSHIKLICPTIALAPPPVVELVECLRLLLLDPEDFLFRLFDRVDKSSCSASREDVRVESIVCLETEIILVSIGSPVSGFEYGTPIILSLPPPFNPTGTSMNDFRDGCTCNGSDVLEE